MKTKTKTFPSYFNVDILLKEIASWIEQETKSISPEDIVSISHNTYTSMIPGSNALGGTCIIVYK
jgi:hypothetical protein